MLWLDLAVPLQKQLLAYYLTRQQYTLAPAGSVPTQPCIRITDRPHPTLAGATDSRQIWLLNLERPLPLPIPAQVLGLLNQYASLDELETCIRQVMANQRYVGTDVMERLIQGPVKVQQPDLPLSRREQEILTLMRAGNSLNQIADQLFISHHTAENHRASIQKKLGLSGPLSLVRYATQTANG